MEAEAMADIRQVSFFGPCCFKCSYILGIGSKAGAELHRDRYGAIDDPLHRERMCLHNPDGLREGHGDANSVCDLFELDPVRYYDLQTQQYEHEIQLRHGSEPVCECDDEDEDDVPEEGPVQETAEADEIKRRLNLSKEGEGLRTTRAKAERFIQWFNGGRPQTMLMPITCMRMNKVLDTEDVPYTSQPTVYTNISAAPHTFLDCWGIVADKTSVWLSCDCEVKLGGSHGSIMSCITSAELDGDTLTIRGFAFGCEAERSDWREVEVIIEVIDQPEAKGPKAPRWVYDEMEAPFTAQEWLTPETQPVQKMQQFKQFTLEAYL